MHLEIEDGSFYLVGKYKSNIDVHERILSSDATRFEHGDLPLENLLNKYCSYFISSHI